MIKQLSPVTQAERAPVNRNRILAVGVSAALGVLAAFGSTDLVEANNNSVPLDVGEPTAFTDFAKVSGDSLSFDPMARAASGDVCKDFGKGAACFWKVRSVEPQAGLHYRPWVNCIRFSRAKVHQHVTCAIGNSKSSTVKAEVGGQWPVGLKTLTAKVGYDVTQTRTITGSITYDINRKNASGVIQYAPVYGFLRKVTQEYTTCYQTGFYHFDRCVPNPHPKPGNLRYAFTEKYDTTAQRIVFDK